MASFTWKSTLGGNVNNSRSQQLNLSWIWLAEAFTDPVENFGPSLHGDALVDRQHGEADVVEVRDAVIGSLPAGPALGTLDGAAASVSSQSAGCRQLTFRRGVDICAPSRPKRSAQTGFDGKLCACRLTVLLVPV